MRILPRRQPVSYAAYLVEFKSVFLQYTERFSSQDTKQFEIPFRPQFVYRLKTVRKQNKCSYYTQYKSNSEKIKNNGRDQSECFRHAP